MVNITFQGPEELVDSLSSPTTWDPIDCAADGRITLEFTPETALDNNVEIFFRSVGLDSWVQFIAGGSLAGVWLNYYDGVWHAVENHFGVVTDGVPTTVECIYSGSSIIIKVDDVEQINNTVNYNLSVADGWMQHDLATNDIEIRAYSQPGVASNELSGFDYSIRKTYYMRADGTAANKEAATSDAQASTAMSLATHNSESDLGGCNIVVSDSGGVYRGVLQPKAGDSNGDTQYIASGDPVISGAAIISGWTNHAGNVWKASVAVQPYQVWVDGTFGDRKTSLVGVVNNYDWFWDDPTNTLYLYDSAGDPDNRVAPGVEGCSLQYALEMQDVSYISFTGLTIEKAWYCGVYGVGCHYLTFDDCTFQWCWADGLILGTTVTNPALNHITIEDCTARYNAAHGISFTATNMSVTDCTVRRNRCYENGRHQFADPVWEYGHNFTGAIKFWTNNLTAGCLRNVVEHNRIYDNGPTSGAFGTGMGSGVWIDYANGSVGNENHVRHNVFYGNTGVPLYNEVASYNLWYNNLCYDNATTLDAGSWSTCNIRCDARGGSDSSYNKFYNNTCYGGLYGILCLSTDQTAGTELNGNEFKNNIIVGITNEVLYADTGGDNDGANGTGNVYNANCFGAESNNFISWGGVDYDTYDAWLAASSQTDNNVEADPLFFNAGADQYWLANGSPCIDAGVNLGATYEDALQQGSVWPDSVSTAKQGLFGTGWEIGAYNHPMAGVVGESSRHSRWLHLLTRRQRGLRT